MTYRKQGPYEWDGMKRDEGQIRQQLSGLAAPVRENLRRILAGSADLDTAGALTVYLCRRNVRLRYDHERDTRTRVLIGARLQRPLADQVKEAAASQGRSVYFWLKEAICEKLAREGGKTP